MAFKATRSRAPASPSVYKVEANKLYGIDSTTSDDNVALGRACGISYFDVEQNGEDPVPGLCNFIRTNQGEIGKRRGAKYLNVNWKTSVREIFKVKALKDIIVVCTIDCAEQNDYHPAIHFLRWYEGSYTDEVVWFFSYDGAGYSRDIFDGMIINEERCVFFALGGFAFVKTGDASSAVYVNGIDLMKASYYESSRVYMFSYDGSDITYKTFDDAGIKTPTVFIGTAPGGGNATEFEPINLLNRWVCEQYIGNGSAVEYVLTVTPDVGHDPIAFVMNESGDWTETEVRWNGNNVKFTSAPPKPTLTGESNVKIYYRHFRKDFPLSDCKIYCNFGVGGYKDRLFLSGSESQPNVVWYSECEDYGYISEISCLQFGDGRCTVRALAGQDTSLAVITDDKCYLVSGTINGTEEHLYNPDAIFVVSHIFESAPPAGYQEPVVFNNEIVYMSTYGLAAITPSNVMDERYAQIRSERVNGWLLNETLEDLRYSVCGEFLVITNKSGRVYLLDSTQFSSTESKPFSYRQYEGYIWNLQADNIWEFNGMLCFTRYRNFCSISFFESGERNDYTDFYKDESEIGQPDGKEYNIPIKCWWETPNLYGTDFDNRKAFSKLGVLLKKTFSPDDKNEINTSVRVWAKKNNEPWKLIKDYDGDQSIFRYDYINYGISSYRSAGKRYAFDKKIKFKKTYSLKLRFENDIEGMPLYLQAFGLEYSR